MTQPPVRKLLTAIGLALVAALAAGALGLLSFVQTVELQTYDLRMRWTADPSQARKDIVVVEIDEISLRRLEALLGRWPWPRLVHAHLIDYLARAPARAIGYDVLLTDTDRRTGFTVDDQEITGKESDQALADATRTAGMVVHLADLTFEGLVGETRTEPSGTSTTVDNPRLKDLPHYDVHVPLDVRPDIRLPFDALARASRWIGHNYLVLDADGPIRRTVPFVNAGGRYIPSLALTVAMLAEGVAPHEVSANEEALSVRNRRVPLVVERLRDVNTGAVVHVRRALIDYQGPPFFDSGRRTTYRTYSFYDLFYSQQQLLAGEAPMVDPAGFKDKIVLVGVTAAGLHDVFTTPFAEGKMPGPHVHAHVVDNLLSGRFIRPGSRWTSVWMVAACALGVALAGVFLTPWVSTALTLVAAVALGWGAVVAFADGLWVPVVQPLAAMSLAVFSGVGYQYFVEGREKRRVKKLFSRFVSPDVYDEILANPALASLGGHRREMSVLFSDIRGFTTASEAGQPEDVVAQLNEYFTRMVAVVFRHRGTVDKFVGDMVMALYGAPMADPDHADHAVATALEMVAELGRLNEEWAARGKAPLDIGIGVNSGVMIAGTIGSDTIMSYTVIGDAVNLGARLESLNKQYGTRIIISDATRLRLRTSPRLRPLGEVVVKGKTKPVDIFEVVETTQQEQGRTGGNTT